MLAQILTVIKDTYLSLLVCTIGYTYLYKPKSRMLLLGFLLIVFLFGYDLIK